MDETYFLKDLEQVKALTDPLRMRIFKVLSREAMTTKQVADILKEPPTKLYRHVQILEKLKLIQLVQTQTRRGIVEKYYEAVAKDLEIDRELFATLPRDKSQKAYYDLLNSILQTTLSEVGRNLAHRQDEPQKGQSIKLIREEIQTTPKKIEALKKQLDAWVKAFEAADQPDGEVNYNLTLVLYPSAPTEKEPPKEQ
jgi:DNA-binding transcriptional ArsR family regulator